MLNAAYDFHALGEEERKIFETCLQENEDLVQVAQEFFQRLLCSNEHNMYFKNPLCAVFHGLVSKIKDSGKELLRLVLHLMGNGALVLNKKLYSLLELYAAGQGEQLESRDVIGTARLWSGCRRGRSGHVTCPWGLHQP